MESREKEGRREGKIGVGWVGKDKVGKKREEQRGGAAGERREEGQGR